MFALSNSDYQDSQIVIIGVPFDQTSSFRAGTSKGPKKIRENSYCFEPYLMEHGRYLDDNRIHDHGDIEGVKGADEVTSVEEEVKKTVSHMIEDDKFPILIGGEHSISPYSVSCHEEVKVLVLDGHLDFRDEYEGDKRSHATSVRRIAESKDVKDVLVMGVRSLSKEESEIEKPEFFTAKEVKGSWEEVESHLDDWIDGPVYLSIDMDVFDPSYAPGVGNPEPFGLEPRYAKSIIQNISKHLVGVDIVETCPKYDRGDITSILAARLIYEIIGCRMK